MNTKHTPGPLTLNFKGVGGVDIEGPIHVICRTSTEDYETDNLTGHNVISLENNTARLLAAAYNSYNKHCGPNAVKCAEEDILGELLEACKTLTDTLETLSSLEESSLESLYEIGITKTHLLSDYKIGIKAIAKAEGK